MIKENSENVVEEIDTLDDKANVGNCIFVVVSYFVFFVFQAELSIEIFGNVLQHEKVTIVANVSLNIYFEEDCVVLFLIDSKTIEVGLVGLAT